LKSLRIQGLRSLLDTGKIDLKPITLLIGRNSSGKSSFLRMLPILRQSLERGKKNPLVLNGRFVDFDNLKTCISNFSKNDEISIEIEIADNGNPNSYHQYRWVRRGIPLDNYTLKSTFTPLGDRDNYVSKLSVISQTISVTLEFSRENTILNCLVDGVNCTDIAHDVKVIQNNYIPSIFDSRYLSEYYDYSTSQSALEKAAINAVKIFSHGRLSSFKIISRIFSAPSSNIEGTFRYIVASDFGKTWKRNVKNWTVSSPGFIRIFKIIKTSKVPSLLSQLETDLERQLSAIRYIAPVRATAQRYYRFNDSSVNEIDSLGSNVSMFLYNMTDTEKKFFREWTKINFGFEFYARSKYGHISITVDDGNEEINLADTGFGYSQILPILIQLWATQHTTRSRRTHPPLQHSSIFAIEQPELHLHPQMIGKLTDCLCNIVSADEDSCNCFVLETHSQSMIDKIGLNIIKGIIHPENVSVVLFDRSVASKPSEIHTTKYSNDGYLEQWPAGFLCAEV